MPRVLSDNAAVTPGAALLAFHVRVGGRLAMRVLAPALAVVFAAYYILRPEFMMLFLRRLIADGTFWETGLPLFGLLRLSSAAAAPRITAGRFGWIRHLPLPRAARRRLEGAAVFAAISPVLLVLGASAAAAVSGSPDRPAVVVVSGLVIGAWAAASSAVRGQAAPAKLFMTAAGVSAATGQLVFVIGGAAILALAEATAGANESIRHGASRGRRFHEVRRGPGLQAAILVRALRWRPAANLLLSILPLASSWLFIRNNDFSPALRRSAWRLGGVLGLFVLLAGVAAAAAVRRPVWPWLRSLPQSSGARVVKDTLLFMALSLPLVAAVAIVSGRAALCVAAVLPCAALRAAAAVRTGPDTRFGPAGRLIVEGTFAAVLLSVSMWPALILPVLVPAAYLDARSQERAIKATRGAALHHRQSGDPLSWSRA